MTERVRVELSRSPYDVVVSSSALEELGAALGPRRRVSVVTQSAIAVSWAAPVLDALDEADIVADVVEIGDGEEAKTLATVEHLTRRFASFGLLRADAVVALGGGVVGDVAGFAAASFHRGVDIVQVPTTLLAQVDSSIGGKTGVNLPEGKNLVGAFHQPSAVLADPRTLTTLPEREFRCGLGEVAKYALMFDIDADPTGLVDLLRLHTDALLARDLDTLEAVITRCAGVKADVVARDEEERTGLRATLNYGHTFAHALETVSDHRLLHGEAVAVGLVFAVNLAHALGRVSLQDVDRVFAVVNALGLPVEAPPGLSETELLIVMRRDKKASGGLTFVLPGPDGLTKVDDPPANALEDAFRAVGVQG